MRFSFFFRNFLSNHDTFKRSKDKLTYLLFLIIIINSSLSWPFVYTPSVCCLWVGFRVNEFHRLLIFVVTHLTAEVRQKCQLFFSWKGTFKSYPLSLFYSYQLITNLFILLILLFLPDWTKTICHSVFSPLAFNEDELEYFAMLDLKQPFNVYNSLTRSVMSSQADFIFIDITNVTSLVPSCQSNFMSTSCHTIRLTRHHVN